MLFTDWKKIPHVCMVLLFCVMANGCDATAPRPMIRVGLGMTVDQLRQGSTYPFKAEAPNFETHTGQPVAAHFYDWMITEPYDLVFVYKDRVLRQDNLGGWNYFIAITTDPNKKIVDSIQITFQNRALTLDEALAAAKQLNDWFVATGFHPESKTDPGLVVRPFYIESQERDSARNAGRIASYQDAREALLDPKSKIIKMLPFWLETDDAVAGLEIVNARREREDVNAPSDETNSLSEREYFLNLTISVRR